MADLPANMQMLPIMPRQHIQSYIVIHSYTRDTQTSGNGADHVANSRLQLHAWQVTQTTESADTASENSGLSCSVSQTHSLLEKP